MICSTLNPEDLAQAQARRPLRRVSEDGRVVLLSSSSATACTEGLKATQKQALRGICRIS